MATRVSSPTAVTTPPSVQVAIGRGATAAEATQQALAQSGLLARLDQIRNNARRTPDRLAIAIKLDYVYPTGPAESSAIAVAPAVAAALGAVLEAAGYSSYTFVETRSETDGGRNPEPALDVAKRLGFPPAVTDRSADLFDDREQVDLGSVVGKEWVGGQWLRADCRIVLGKNRTHRRYLSWGGLGALIGCYARPDRLRAMRVGGRTLYESAALLRDRVPVHFALLDAWVSGDGSAGDAVEGHRRETRAIIVSPEVVAADWVAAEMMCLDPALNPFLREAMLRSGVFHLQRIGNQTPWPEWHNVSELRAAWGQIADDRHARRPEKATA